MPEVSRFFGITIQMYYKEHNPPHFHALYSGQDVLVSIDPIRVLEGKLSKHARALVFDWAALHQSELLTNWDRARKKLPLEHIEGLD